MSISGSPRTRAPKARDVRNQLSEAEFMLGQVGRASGERARGLLSQVENRLRSAADTVQGLQQDAVDRARAAGRVADDYVSENPWRMAGVAAALGLLVGVLVGRR
jgi:ElaB/YqjD/DUF883 family membrane-anchored ribosome-binding protein